MLVESQTIKAIALATGEDAGRIALCGVHVRPSGHLEATDAHWLLEADPCPTPDDEFPRSPVVSNGFSGIIPAKPLLEAAKAANTSGRGLPVLSHVQIGQDNAGQTVAVASRDLDTWSVQAFRPFDGPFPDTRGIWPTGLAGRLEVGLKAEYLAKIARAATLSAGKEAVVRLSLGKPTEAVLFSFLKRSGVAVPMRGLVMPFRLPDAETPAK